MTTRRIVPLPLALLLALPVGAGEPEVETAKNPDRESVISASPSAAPKDSPLVAAARRSKTKAKPKFVITNENLSRMGAGARVTTTSVQPVFTPLPKLEEPRPTSEMDSRREKAAAKRQADKAAMEKSAAEAKRDERRSKLAEIQESDYVDDLDPAEAERLMAEEAAPQPAAAAPPGLENF